MHGAISSCNTCLSVKMCLQSCSKQHNSTSSEVQVLPCDHVQAEPDKTPGDQAAPRAGRYIVTAKGMVSRPAHELNSRSQHDMDHLGLLLGLLSASLHFRGPLKHLHRWRPSNQSRYQLCHQFAVHSFETWR
jgi:hypothetical protein